MTGALLSCESQPEVVYVFFSLAHTTHFVARRELLSWLGNQDVRRKKIVIDIRSTYVGKAHSCIR